MIMIKYNRLYIYIYIGKENIRFSNPFLMEYIRL